MNRIRAARMARGWSQEDLADHAGVSERTIHSVEKGAFCRGKTRRGILNALEIPITQWKEYFPQKKGDPAPQALLH